MIYDVIVVGGGASGMMAAITGKKHGKSVLLLERMDKLGKKILATGNGRCNLTNDCVEETSYRGNRPGFSEYALKKFSQEELLCFFQSLGMLTTQINGYYYPASLQASTVVETLVETMRHLKIEIETGVEVSKIEHLVDFYQMRNKDGKTYKSRQVILSTGGKAQEKLGSNGSGYVLAKQLGHHMTDVYPGLVALESSDTYFKNLHGVRQVCNIKVFVNDKEEASQRGEVQFTKYGISGIPVFQISRYTISALRKKKKVVIELNLMPDMLTLEETMEQMKNLCEYKTIEQFLNGCMNCKLSKCILQRCKIKPTVSVSRMSHTNWQSMLDMIKHFQVAVSNYKGFDMAQVTVGGVDTREVIQETLESKYHKGLFFTGELLDVDGTCGGYNLQWAFSSGYIAAMNLK
ncbi:MAG: NAD(P)/FAD-dependent oxidoreductase [Anaerostipes sp.]|nr:NAD(P)/FAD-dependent oxidoreductase [Anaerostipes sp.]